MTFHFEYEVFEPVPDLAVFLRLHDLSDPVTGVVTDLREVTSARPLNPGETRSMEITLPNLKLRPNLFHVYACLSSIDDSSCFDVIDNGIHNVNLPLLEIKAATTAKTLLGGYVTLDYEFKESRTG